MQLSFDYDSHPTDIDTYGRVHDQCRKVWGKASEHQCVNPTNSAQCKGYGAQWAYDHKDPTQGIYYRPERRGHPAQVLAFSVWPEFYMPLCRHCHKTLDLAALGRPVKPGKRGNGRSQEIPPKTGDDWRRWYAQQGKNQHVDEEGHDLRILWMVLRETVTIPS